MPRNPDMPCAECGRLMWRSATSQPEGQAVCRPCRRKAAGRGPTERALKKPRVEWSPQVLECPICGDDFTQHQHSQVYCSTACRESRRGWSYAKVASASERGYGSAHQRERRKWKLKVDAGQVNCCLCGHWIEPGSKWHLDHTEDRTGYRGAAHASCNVRDGARRGNKAMPRPQIAKVCDACRAQFSTVYPRQRYCSRECRPKSEGKRVGAHCKVSFIVCPSCAVLFTARPGRKTCSQSCGYEMNKASQRLLYRRRFGIADDAPLYTRRGEGGKNVHKSAA